MRLNESLRYRAVLRQGRSISNRVLKISFLANSLTHPRLGFALAKRSVPKATRRNLIKRLVREAYRQRQQRLGNIDFVVTAHKGATQLDRRELSVNIQKLWESLCP